MNTDKIINELHFKAIRSSGAGGQHVNKVASKIELSFNLTSSYALSDSEKQLLKTKLASKLTKENVLIIFCEATRSQHRNKNIAIQRFLTLLKANLQRPKKRRPTKPTKASVKRKLENKKRVSLKKALRKKPKPE